MELESYLKKRGCLWAMENISERLDRDKLASASKLCAAYPHLDANLLSTSLVLTDLICKGVVGFDLNSILAALGNMDAEEKLRVLQVLVEAQTDYASGEAKILQYFYH